MKRRFWSLSKPIIFSLFLIFVLILVNRYFSRFLVFEGFQREGFFSQQKWRGILSVLFLGSFIIFSIFSKAVSLKNPAIIFLIIGILANSYERIRYGFVFDYWKISLYSFHWPTFNLADLYLTIGIIWLIIQLVNIKPYFKNQSSKKE